MAPTSAVRSFTITLAIAITIIGPQANGFTINRNNITSSRTDTPSTDLSSDESFQLSVRDDLKRPNDIKTRNDEVPNKTTKSSNSNETTTDTMKNRSELNTNTSTIASTEIRSTTENTRIPTISSDTVEVFDSLEDLKGHIHNYNTTGFRTGSSIKYDQLDWKETTTTIVNSSETQFSTEISTFIDQIATESESTGNKLTTNASLSVQQDLITATWNNFITYEMTTENTDISKKISVSPIVEETEITSAADIRETDLPPTVTTSNEYMTTSTEVQQYQTSSDSNMTDTITDIPNIEITEPLWKKYTTIVRKRVTSSEDTSQTTKTENDAMKAETSNTHESFEKVTNITPIPTLEEFTENLLSVTNQLSINGDTVSKDIGNVTVAHESTVPSPYTISTGAKRTGTVQTKRAGYLDNSEKASTPISVSVKSIEQKDNDTKLYGTAKNIQALETERPDSKKASGSESLSQMAADAIQEELMKEEALINHQQNINRHLDAKTENENVKPIEDDHSDLVTTFPTDVETLNVQPISHDRTKTTLYTVSPNYKPMKKIDVQPSKPFVRDPDDNSWRNESISSLGIVFKPKNSSKSFKEILKNKTQTELSNLLERDAKDDVPDLRVRLEKIAEVRKTKKKKMNKDGVEVYIDYEEGNSDESSKPELISAVLSSAEMSKLLTSSKSQSNLDLTTPMTIWNEMEANIEKTTNTQALFKNLGLDPYTTRKPIKKFNIAEYYDTTDEYDADYVTMSKLDLQKFVPSRTTQTPGTYPIGPPLTKPMKSLFPDRKPTVQYFPPRTPEKLNNVDTDFEKKINLYTFKNPKIEPFVTVAPVPIATIKPDLATRPGMRPDFRPDIRATVKPTDFTMYTPAVLGKNYYLTNTPRMTEPDEAFVINDGSLNRGSYIIKHYRDFLAAAAKDNDDERSSDFLAIHTQTVPPQDDIVSYSDVGRATPKGRDEDYDYDLQFRKQILSHFVENFNQNSERFKVDFPILYNNSVVHRKVDGNGRATASSRAYLKRLYGNEGTATKANSLLKKSCEPNCDMTVELSPAYELHYYVPEQEERQEAEPRRGAGAGAAAVAAPRGPPYETLA